MSTKMKSPIDQGFSETPFNPLPKESYLRLVSLREKEKLTESEIEELVNLEDQEFNLFLRMPGVKVSQQKWEELRPARNRWLAKK
jgi:hypothetical protein